MRSPLEPPRLIVNADDYGYFFCVSKGILEAAAQGVVTATGVFANMARFEEQAARLRDCDALDAGVHLNLTDGTPLTREMQKSLAPWSGRFARKFAMAKAIIAGAIKVDAVKAEWRAQIERCLQLGLKLRFLNSHEHMHLLPSLFTVAKALASDYDIRHVRFPTSRIAGSSSLEALFRGAVIKALGAVNRRYGDSTVVHFLGMETSGRLKMQYLEKTVPQLRAGQVYELMCHPGKLDPSEVTDPRLLRYHDWQGELSTLTSPALRELLDRFGIRLIGYRDLAADSDRRAARHA
jgi:predicted glycoside hydrolase/deacetylase ChbG (UPF0249 family)